jgi:DNA polymerase family A/3'-5' exonuclease
MKPFFPPNLCDVIVDFETYYATGYSLTGMGYWEYITHPLYKTHLAGVKVGTQAATVTRTDDQLNALLDAPNDRLICHNAPFDGLILALRHGYQPAQYVCTLALSRAVIGAQLKRHSLDSVGQYLGLGGKRGHDVLVKTRGKRDLSPDELNQMAYYAERDAELTQQIYEILYPELPESEHAVLDWTIRNYVNPVIALDPGILAEARHVEDERLAQLLTAVAGDKKLLMSNDKFAGLLQARGVEPPTKEAKKPNKDGTVKTTWAFAKTDKAFLDLEDHPDKEIATLVSARLGAKSTIESTRVNRMLAFSDLMGMLPIGLSYSGAMQTHRFAGGADKTNVQNIPGDSKINTAMQAPEGYAILNVDSAQIECRVAMALGGHWMELDALHRGDDVYASTASRIFGHPVTKKSHPDKRQTGKVAVLSCVAEGQLVLTDRGLVPIQLVAVADRVWDGESFVTHKGVVYQGVRDVIRYQGLVATADHRVCLENGDWCELGQAAATQARIATTARGRDAVRFLGDRVGDAGRYGEARERVLPVRVRVGDPSGHWEPAGREDSGVPSLHGGVATGSPESAAPAAQARIRDAQPQPATLSDALVQGADDTRVGLGRVTVQPLEDTTVRSRRDDGRGYPAEELARDCGQARVFDILDCGPHQRFTVSGLLVHNCAYGIGAPKFKNAVETDKKSPMPIELATAKLAVDGYRKTFFGVAGSWKRLASIIAQMAEGLTPRQVEQWPFLRFEQDRIVLPNGMKISYPRMELVATRGVESFRDQYAFNAWTKGVCVAGRPDMKPIHGAQMLENICQALARIIVVEQMAELMRRGHRIVLQVHDSIVLVVPEDQAEAVLAEVEEVMGTPPTWWPQLKVSSAGNYGKTYAEAKKERVK